MNENLVLAAHTYAARHELELAEPLGSGKDGIVLVAKRKDKPAGVAVKIFRFPEAYWRETRVYERLREAGVTRVLGFNVPQMVASNEEMRVIEMTIVKPPFVLDFAGAYLDARPEFPAEVWADWEAERREQSEEHWPTVEKILAAFKELGIYLLDVSPGNIGFLD